MRAKLILPIALLVLASCAEAIVEGGHARHCQNLAEDLNTPEGREKFADQFQEEDRALVRQVLEQIMADIDEETLPRIKALAWTGCMLQRGFDCGLPRSESGRVAFPPPEMPEKCKERTGDVFTEAVNPYYAEASRLSPVFVPAIDVCEAVRIIIEGLQSKDEKASEEGLRALKQIGSYLDSGERWESPKIRPAAQELIAAFEAEDFPRSERALGNLKGACDDYFSP